MSIKPNNSKKSIVDAVLRGDIRTGSKLMRWLDDREPGATDILQDLYPHTGRARVLGITGNPGSGKSTLVDKLTRHYRERDLRVGVVCVDPTSPFSGGAILGDRIRMMSHATDPGVFIRSLATRGTLGGLSRSTHEVVAVMDAMGYDLVIIETVGVGQDEIDVVRLAETSVVVVVPGLGDDIQAIKAGILEVADVFCVNKADNPNVHRTVTDLRHLLSLSPVKMDWVPPIQKTIASTGEGLIELGAAIESHKEHLTEHQSAQNKSIERARHILGSILRDQMGRLIEEKLQEAQERDALLEQVAERGLDPYSAAEQVLTAVLKSET